MNAGDRPALSYTVVRPSDGEKLARTAGAIDAEVEAQNYAEVDDESIVVVRTLLRPGGKTSVRIIAVAHPGGALYRTSGTPGGRVA